MKATYKIQMIKLFLIFIFIQLVYSNYPPPIIPCTSKPLTQCTDTCDCLLCKNFINTNTTTTCVYKSDVIDNHYISCDEIQYNNFCENIFLMLLQIVLGIIAFALIIIMMVGLVYTFLFCIKCITKMIKLKKEENKYIEYNNITPQESDNL